MNIDVVVGGQYGSEAKGHITKRLLDRHHQLNRMHYTFDPQPLVNVRVAGPNAGHTAYDSTGRRWALRQVPVGATCEDPMTLYIAAGSEIDPPVLMEELTQLRDAGLLRNKSVFIDPNATLITPRHKTIEGMYDLTNKIGSTGKGIGAARAERVMRHAERVMDSKRLYGAIAGFDGVMIAPLRYHERDRVVIEGTQGYGLGLHGKHYPQCTSSNCRAIDFLAMASLNPFNAHVHVHVVARMFPIRVAGNSGSMYEETSWEELGLPEEKTTVTQKVRRVGQWDGELVSDAVYANGGAPTAVVALTMVDQKWPSFKGLTTPGELIESPDYKELVSFIETVEQDCGTRVSQVTTGPTTGVFL